MRRTAASGQAKARSLSPAAVAAAGTAAAQQTPSATLEAVIAAGAAAADAQTAKEAREEEEGEEGAAGMDDDDDGTGGGTAGGGDGAEDVEEEEAPTQRRGPPYVCPSCLRPLQRMAPDGILTRPHVINGKKKGWCEMGAEMGGQPGSYTRPLLAPTCLGLARLLPCSRPPTPPNASATRL